MGPMGTPPPGGGVPLSQSTGCGAPAPRVSGRLHPDVALASWGCTAQEVHETDTQGGPHRAPRHRLFWSRGPHPLTPRVSSQGWGGGSLVLHGQAPSRLPPPLTLRPTEDLRHGTRWWRKQTASTGCSLCEMSSFVLLLNRPGSLLGNAWRGVTRHGGK